MKIITVPKEVTVTLEGMEPKEFPFKKALILHLDNYGDLKTISQIRDAQKVIDAIEAGNGTISLEDKQYELLAAACKGRVYHPTVTRQLLSYYSAVEAAEDVEKK
jgi:hypothetical protein